ARSGSFAISHELEHCDGATSATVAGLVDIDGDGKPDLVDASSISGTMPATISSLRNPRGLGALDSGRINHLDNGYGGGVDIEYRSAKTDPSSKAHQVPSPEIVVSKVTPRLDKGGDPLEPTLFAYGDIHMHYQPLLARWQPTGYGRRVSLQSDPGGIFRN